MNADEASEAGVPVAHRSADNTAFVAVPVCDLCHKDPAHRTVNRLKCHFFAVGAMKLATVMAGSDTIGERT
jgi:hypothetical protein